jgi:hypothetical protein
MCAGFDFLRFNGVLRATKAGGDPKGFPVLGSQACNFAMNAGVIWFAPQ